MSRVRSRLLWFWVVATIGLGAAACGRGQSKPEKAEGPRGRPVTEAEARALVQRFYRSVARQDCDDLLQFFPAGSTRESCQRFVAHMLREGIALQRIVWSKPDGRNRAVQMVKVAFTKRGEPKTMLLRVLRDKGRLVLLY